MPLPIKNPSPLLVDKVRGYLDRLPPWLRGVVTLRVEKQKFDAKVAELDSTALASELKQEVTDEKLRTNTFLGDGAVGSGNDMSQLPASHPSQVVLTGTGQVAAVTETVSATETHLTEGPPLQDGSSEKVGDVWVTKKVEATTFDKKVFLKQVDDLLPAEFRASIPQVLTQNTVNGVAAMPTLGVNDQLKKEEQTKVGVKEVSTQSRDLSGTKPTLIGQRIDNNFNGAIVQLFKDVVPDTTAIAPVYGMTEAAVTPYDDKNAIKEVWIASAFPLVQLRNYDSELNAQVISNVQIVGQGSAYTPASGVLDYEERKIDSKHTLRVENFVATVPAPEITYSTQMITFPAILSYISFQLAPVAGTNRYEPQWTAGVRASFTAPAQLQTNINYFLNPPAPLSLFVWKPTDIMFKGVSYTVNISGVLCDSWSNIGVSYGADNFYNGLVDRFSIAATVPSASTYVSLIGSLQRISCTISRYKRLWVMKTTYLTIA